MDTKLDTKTASTSDELSVAEFGVHIPSHRTDFSGFAIVAGHVTGSDAPPSLLDKILFVMRVFWHDSAGVRPDEFDILR